MSLVDMVRKTLATSSVRTPAVSPPRCALVRKPYAPPAVLAEGDVRAFVLGGSIGSGDSAPGGQPRNAEAFLAARTTRAIGSGASPILMPFRQASFRSKISP